jgi:hypothetical protein
MGGLIVHTYFKLHLDSCHLHWPWAAVAIEHEDKITEQIKKGICCQLMTRAWIEESQAVDRRGTISATGSRMIHACNCTKSRE